MKTFKRILALSVCFIMVTSVLIGCGQDKPSTTEEGTQKVASTPEQTSEAAPAKKVTLTWPCIWVGVDSKASTISKFVKEFNEENKDKIEIVIEENSDYQAYRDKLRTTLSAGNAPDFFTIDSDIPFYLNSGKLLDLTEEINSGWGNDFVSGALSNTTVDGKVFAVPYEMAVLPVMYNKGLLEKAGWSKFPETFDELWKCCDDLVKAGITPFSQMTGENAWTTMLWYSQALLAIGGPDIYDNPNDPAYVQAAEIIVKMFKYTTKDAVGAGASVSGGHFLAEETAIFMNGPWYIGRLKTDGQNNMYERVGIAPCPVFEGGRGSKGGYLGNPQALLAAGATDDKDKADSAIKFMKYITKPERIAELSAASGALFYVRSVDIGVEIERLQAEMIKQANEAPYIVGHFQFMNPPAVYNELPMALSGLVLGDLTPQEFVDALNSKR